MIKRRQDLKAFILIGLIIAGAILISGCTEKSQDIESTQTGNAPDEIAQTEKISESHWSYEGEEGPDHWTELGYPDCSGNEQSPIDIPSGTPPHEADISFNYNPSALNIVNNGHAIQVTYNEGSTMGVENKTYKLLQFHFHAPSEHTFNSEYYDIELHLVHQSGDGEYAVVGVMLVSGSENNAYAPVWENLPAEKGELETISGVNVNAVDLLPGNRSYYRYNGSFTTPPCTEGVRWFVLDNSIELSRAQIDAFKAIYSHNNRPIQALNQRKFADMIE